MILYILFVIYSIQYVLGTLLNFIYRKQIYLAHRPIYLHALSNFGIWLTLLAITIGLELYYIDDDDNDNDNSIWKSHCILFFPLPLTITLPYIGWLILLGAFKAQVQYFKSLDNLKNQNISFYAKYKKFTDKKIITIFMITVNMIFITPPILTSILYKPLVNTISDCYFPLIIIYAAQVIPMVIFLGYLIFKFIHFKDPFGIKKESIYLLIVCQVTIGPFLLLQLLEFLPGQIYTRNFQPTLFIMCFAYLHVPVNLWYPLYLTYKDKKTLKIISKSSETIKHVLENPITSERFSYYVAQHWCTEGFLFARDVHQFKKMMSSGSSRNDQTIVISRAKEICDKYLDPESYLLINIDQSISNQILQDLKNSNIHQDMFAKAENDIHAQLQAILQRWKTTDSYHEMVTTFKEDLQTIQLSTHSQ